MIIFETIILGLGVQIRHGERYAQNWSLLEIAIGNKESSPYPDWLVFHIEVSNMTHAFRVTQNGLKRFFYPNLNITIGKKTWVFEKPYIEKIKQKDIPVKPISIFKQIDQ